MKNHRVGWWGHFWESRLGKALAIVAYLALVAAGFLFGYLLAV